MPGAVTILVTHLLGVGHLARAAAIGRALAKAGFRVTLISGGMPAPGVDATGLTFVQLPPRRILGTDFRRLLNADGRESDEAEEAARLRALGAALAESAPDVLIVELYPFGRRTLGREFEHALAQAAALRPPPAVLCSIRDVLAPPSSVEKARATVDMLGRYFDAILVHGDESVIPLSLSWPVTPELARRCVYTGYVDEAGGDAETAGGSGGAPRQKRVVVSGGGSGAGLPLFEAAIGARPLLDPSIALHVLVGHGVGEAEFIRLYKKMEPNLAVERARPDFRALLARSALSVSRAGYNTVLDIAATGVRAVLVPFEEGGEVEQRLRAERLAARGFATVVPEAELSPRTLAKAIETAIDAPPPPPAGFDRGGAARTAQIVRGWEGRGRSRDRALRRIEAALGEAKRLGIAVPVWWRDDDATRPSAALDRLIKLAELAKAPVALAVIPAAAIEDLARTVEAHDDIDILVHGIAHANHAPPDSKKQELGPHRPVAEMQDGLAKGLARLRALFGPRCLPVLVPPWNRIAPALLPHLPGLGFTGLSGFGRRDRLPAVPGLTIVNTHLDPIDWRGDGGCRPVHVLMGELAAEIEARIGEATQRRIDGHRSLSVAATQGFAPEAGRQHNSSSTIEPIGLLTHHLRHDAWAWGFLEELLSLLMSWAEVRFLPARAVFQSTDRAESPFIRL